MKTQLTSILAATVAFACAMGNSARAAVQYTVTDLGTLGGNFSYATGINDNGEVVGSSYTTGGPNTGVYRAFSWTAGGGMQNLGVLPSGANIRAYGLNDNGLIVGDSGDTNGFLYNGSLTDLLPSGITHAYSANDSGQISGYNSSLHAIVRDPNGTVHDLGTLAGGSYAYGWAINSSGEVTGISSSSTSPAHAYRYAGSGALIDLGTLGGSESEGGDINDNDVIAGGADLSNGIEHVVMWDSSNVIHDLGALPGGGVSRGLGINNLGTIVGESSGHAILWTPAGGLQDLNSLIDPSSGWTLETARAINDSGQIVGWGWDTRTGSGGLAAFLLTPIPEPASVSVLGFASLLLLTRRRQNVSCR